VVSYNNPRVDPITLVEPIQKMLALWWVNCDWVIFVIDISSRVIVRSVWILVLKPLICGRSRMNCYWDLELLLLNCEIRWFYCVAFKEINQFFKH
jgi:hypothetical protein